MLSEGGASVVSWWWEGAEGQDSPGRDGRLNFVPQKDKMLTSGSSECGLIWK